MQPEVLVMSSREAILWYLSWPALVAFSAWLIWANLSRRGLLHAPKS